MAISIHHNEAEAIRSLLVGRTVDFVDITKGTLTLDDGSVLLIEGNEGCGGCESGWFELTALNDFHNRIMHVDVVEEDTADKGSYSDRTVFELFVYGAGAKPHAIATVTGTYGNGYYGAGFTIHVKKQK